MILKFIKKLSDVYIKTCINEILYSNTEYIIVYTTLQVDTCYISIMIKFNLNKIFNNNYKMQNAPQ